MSSSPLDAQSTGFTAGKLAVLRIGDGHSGDASDFMSRQNPVFIDEYDPAQPNQAQPIFSVALPTTGSNALWLNGDAYTEGGMTRSADHRILTLTGYCGDILSQRGTPSKLAYDRGIGVIEPDGSFHLAFRSPKWYGLSGDKTNPRGVVTDGQDNYWGCGNVMGDLFYTAATGPVTLPSAESTRAVRIVNHVLYTSIMSSDGDDRHPGGIYTFIDASGAAVALPKSEKVSFSPFLPVSKPYGHIVGFDVSPQGDLAYMADAAYGIVKYIKSGGEWKLACRFYIPGYDAPNHGLLANPPNNSVMTGCFGLAVDFSGPAPVIYATTTDYTAAALKSANANRLIRLDDTTPVTSGLTVTNPIRVLATAPATNICFRALDFTPEPRP